MRKRILCWVVVLVILAASLIPAFALSAGSGDVDSVYNSSFIIDDVVTPLGDVYPFPLNSGSFNNYEVAFDFDGCFYGTVSNIGFGDSSLCPGVFTADVTLFDGTTVGSYGWSRFCSNFCFVDANSSFVISYDTSELTVYQVIVRLSLLDVILVGESYEVTNYYIEDVFSTMGSDRIDICDYVRLLISDNTGVNYTQNVSSFFQGLSVDICFQDKSSSTTRYNFSVAAQPANYNTAGQFWHWADMQNLQVVYKAGLEGEDDLTGSFGWLASTIGAFLNLEIFPGFSLNTIFTFIFVLLIILLLIKIFS